MVVYKLIRKIRKLEKQFNSMLIDQSINRFMIEKKIKEGKSIKQLFELKIIKFFSITLAIFICSVILYFNFSSKFESSSYIEGDNFISEMEVSEHEQSLHHLFEVLKDKTIICRRIGCVVTDSDQQGESIAISLSLLNLFVKFKGLLDINYESSRKEVTILIDGELAFSSNSYQSPVSLNTEIKATWINVDQQKSIFFKSIVKSKIIGFAADKVGNSVTITTLENIQGNLINKLMYSKP